MKTIHYITTTELKYNTTMCKYTCTHVYIYNVTNVILQIFISKKFNYFN